MSTVDKKGKFHPFSPASGGGTGDASEATLLEVQTNTDVLGAETDASKDFTENGTISARLKYVSLKVAETANSVSDLFNITNGTLIPSLSNIEADIEELRTTKPVDLITTSLGGSTSGTILTPSSGYKLRIYDMKFGVDVDTVTEIALNGGGVSGTLERYFNPKTGGLYGGTRGQNYTELETDETLDISITGTGNYAVNIKYIEVI